MNPWRALVAGLLLLLLGSACRVEDVPQPDEDPSREPVRENEAAVYWSDERSLTEEEIELGRYDDSWRLAASIDTFRQRAAEPAGSGIPPPVEVDRVDRVDADSIAIPPSWGDLPSVLDVQVLLDRARFSPGAIDGKWGKNTEKAVYWFQRREALPATGTVDSLTIRRLREVAGEPDRTIVPYALAADDVAGPFVDSLPSDVYAQAEMECLCYRSATEKVAERFHVTEELLAKLNPSVSIDSLAAGDTLAVPALASPGDTLPEIAQIVISDGGGYLHALDASGRIIHHFPATLGSRYDPSPEGRLTVTDVALRPAFYYQPELLAGERASDPPARLPPGPNSPVGLVWMQLSKEHYGIHGTRDPASIGYVTSSGCVRLTNWDALQISRRIEAGVAVRFIDLDGRNDDDRLEDVPAM